jgi:hypothetical protein
MSNDERTRRLCGHEIAALKFAARRQLARWAGKPLLNPRQHAQRIALTSAVHVLQDKAFADGCELRVPARPATEDTGPARPTPAPPAPPP